MDERRTFWKCPKVFSRLVLKGLSFRRLNFLSKLEIVASQHIERKKRIKFRRKKTSKRGENQTNFFHYWYANNVPNSFGMTDSDTNFCFFLGGNAHWPIHSAQIPSNSSYAVVCSPQLRTSHFQIGKRVCTYIIWFTAKKRGPNTQTTNSPSSIEWQPTSKGRKTTTENRRWEMKTEQQMNEKKTRKVSLFSLHFYHCMSCEDKGIIGIRPLDFAPSVSIKKGS